MSTYPKLVFKCEDLGIWVMTPEKNPMAEIRRDDGTVLGPQQQLMSIVAHIDLSEWDEVVEPA